MRRVVAIAVALAICAGGSLGTAVATSAGKTATAAAEAKRTKAARCASLARTIRLTKARPRNERRAAARRRIARRRSAQRRARKLGCPAKTTKGSPSSATSPSTATPPPPPATIPLASSTPIDPGTMPAQPAPPPPPPPSPVVSTLGVGAYDIAGFLLRLTRTTIAAGELTVFFRNNDVSDHNLWIEGPGGVVEQISDTVGENGGGSRTLTVGAGTWRLFCSLPDHGSMTRTITVTP